MGLASVSPLSNVFTKKKYIIDVLYLHTIGIQR